MRPRLKPALLALGSATVVSAIGWWWMTFGEVIRFGYLSWHEAGGCLVQNSDICSLAKALCLGSPSPLSHCLLGERLLARRGCALSEPPDLRTGEGRAMTMTLRQIPTDAQELATFKQAMRHLIGGVSVITAGSGEIRTGLTATSAISLSLDPPTMLVCVNRDASAWPVIQRERHYCVNILDSRHQDLADRFAGRNGINGAARYEGARWRQFATGAWGLEDALAVVDCAVEEIIERHSHAIIIGAVKWVHLGGGSEALVYGHGGYRTLKLVLPRDA